MAMNGRPAMRVRQASSEDATQPELNPRTEFRMMSSDPAVHDSADASRTLGDAALGAIQEELEQLKAEVQGFIAVSVRIVVDTPIREEAVFLLGLRLIRIAAPVDAADH
jgi:hypothetical protein